MLSDEERRIHHHHHRTYTSIIKMVGARQAGQAQAGQGKASAKARQGRRQADAV